MDKKTPKTQQWSIAVQVWVWFYFSLYTSADLFVGHAANMAAFFCFIRKTFNWYRMNVDFSTSLKKYRIVLNCFKMW